MRIHRYTDPQLFLDHSQEWLVKDELKNSAMLAVARLLVTNLHPFERPYYMAVIESDDGIIGCAVRSPPDSLLLAEVPASAIALLAADVATVYEKLPGVTAMENVARAFAEHWQRRRGDSWSINHWDWYALEQVVPPENRAPGALRLAESSDLEFVRSCAPNFARETDTLVDVAAFYERRVSSASLYIWENEGPCSLVAASGITPNSIRISGVYTTPDNRLNGYASAAVAEVSQLMLDRDHKFCVLFADRSDPHANSMYQKIGYHPIFKNVNISLID